MACFISSWSGLASIFSSSCWLTPLPRPYHAPPTNVVLAPTQPGWVGGAGANVGVGGWGLLGVGWRAGWLSRLGLYGRGVVGRGGAGGGVGLAVLAGGLVGGQCGMGRLE